MSQGQGRHIGTLIVVILKARNLPNKRHIGKQDPYCQVIFNGEKRRTKAIKRGGQHPEWDEEIRFELYEDVDELPQIPGVDPPPPPPKANGKGPPKVKGGSFMAVACYAEDVREPDLIGETKVDLTEVLTKGETDEWFTIMHKDKYCGEVYFELTFWLDEPPPTKKTTPKQTNGQYGGRGTFVPLGESASSSLSDLSRYGSTGSRDEIRRENLPPSLRSSNSRLDIYVAPYESTRSHSSSVDGVVNEFAELNVNHGNRRLSMPVQPTGGSYFQRPASAAPPEPSYDSQVSQVLHGLTYSDGGQGYHYDSSPGQLQPYDSAPLPDPYQPAYEQAATPAPSTFQQVHRPRYSLPPQSSGFMPLPQPSGFVPMNSGPPAPSGFLPPPSATPAPIGYGAVVPTRVASSSFSTLSPALPAPSGFSQGPPPSSSYPPLSQSPSLYYPPPQQNPPPSSTPFPQHQHSLPPSSSFPQHQSPLTSTYSASTPPTSSFPHSNSTPPTSSFPHNLPPTSSYPQLPPPPPASTPPGHQHGYSSSPSTPNHLQPSQSAPPDQPSYGYGHQPSSFDNIPPPPPLSDSPSAGGYGGSRPLPQPQSQPGQSPQSHYSRKQSSLPVPPGPPPQGYYNGTQNGPPALPAATSYQSIPPPPPLPGQVPPPPLQSSFSNGHQLALPGPPPPLPSSMSMPQQLSAQPPPKRRPSLPAPPMSYQQQQSAFQALPPPPPPPSLPSHLQYEPPASSFMPAASNQGYYPPGPPPRPPQYLPGPPQVAQGGYSPVHQPEYSYGQ
ncbi:hypothetical protein GSI_00450 [Ganoderma sinense ZZ0214-1]|uniref:C2 domain-containing protein n=1 Tax=Ganoderma sinense ZZ0214-1 TaxID=1077348 RepID=A0A2G8SSK3_9APHY|nr:hypothetical protein GSI_00450 [Ganoderma sinense ZZ0214-1]